VGQKSPVEIEHSQESTKLTGGLWRLALLEVNHSLIRRFGALGGNLVTEEGDFGC
jgi:hypothetical protein